MRVILEPNIKHLGLIPEFRRKVRRAYAYWITDKGREILRRKYYRLTDTYASEGPYYEFIFTSPSNPKIYGKVDGIYGDSSCTVTVILYNVVRNCIWEVYNGQLPIGECWGYKHKELVSKPSFHQLLVKRLIHIFNHEFLQYTLEEMFGPPTSAALDNIEVEISSREHLGAGSEGKGFLESETIQKTLLVYVERRV